MSLLTPQVLIDRAAELHPQPLPGWAGPGQTDVLRLDQLHPRLSGNKIFKLYGFLSGFAGSEHARLLSFGGPWSNHLHALAAVAAELKIPAVGIVRGYEHLPLTATLQDCRDMGMQLEFASKTQYAQRYDADWQQSLSEQWQALVIPEGGEGESGQQGFAALAPVFNDYDEIWLASGTGTTALGIARLLKPEQTLVGVNAVADQGERLRQWQALPWACGWQLLDDYHGGAFGRCNDNVLGLIRRYDALQLPLEPVYTAKLLWALESERDAGRLKNRRRLLIHSGGLQGRRGFPQLTAVQAL